MRNLLTKKFIHSISEWESIKREREYQKNEWERKRTRKRISAKSFFTFWLLNDSLFNNFPIFSSSETFFLSPFLPLFSSFLSPFLLFLPHRFHWFLQFYFMRIQERKIQKVERMIEKEEKDGEEKIRRREKEERKEEVRKREKKEVRKKVIKVVGWIHKSPLTVKRVHKMTIQSFSFFLFSFSLLFFSFFLVKEGNVLFAIFSSFDWFQVSFSHLFGHWTRIEEKLWKRKNQFSSTTPFWYFQASSFTHFDTLRPVHL